MENLMSLVPLANIVIALVALFTGQGLIFNWLLSPVKENQVRQENNHARMEKVLTEIQKAVEKNQRDLEENQKSLTDNKQHINRVESEQKRTLSMLESVINSVKEIQKDQIEMYQHLQHLSHNKS